MTLVSLGRLFATRRNPAAPVAVRYGRALSYGQFASDVAGVAAMARDARVARGAVLAGDPYNFLAGMLGLLHAGATVVVPPDGLPTTLANLRDRFDILFCDDLPPPGVPASPIARGDTAVSPEPIDPATAMLEFYTSGSTGAAKCIAKPLVMLDREIATLHARFASQLGSGPVFATAPHRHVFGLTFHLLWPLVTGRCFVSHIDALWEDLLARDLADAVLVTSPAHLTRLGGISRVPVDRRLRAIFTAGAPLSAAQSRQAAAVLGVAPIEIFGSTETGAIATRCQMGAMEPWQPLPDITVSGDANGNMVVQSPYGPEGEPFISADRIEMLPDGSFHFLGRADRVAKVEGKRVSLPRIEQELCALSAVEEAAVVVIGDAPARLAAAVVLRPEARATLDRRGPFRFGRELRRQLAHNLEQAALPKSWRFVEALPRSAMGKRRDPDIRALFTPRRELTP